MTQDASPQPPPSPPSPAPEDVAAGYYKPQWDRTTRTLVTIFMVIAGVYALTLLTPVIQMLTFAFIFAFVLRTPIRTLHRRLQLPWGGAVGLTYLAVVIALIFILVTPIPAAVRGINDLWLNVQNAYADLQIRLEEYQPEDGLIEVFGADIDLHPFIEPARAFILDEPILLEDAASTLEPHSENPDIIPAGDNPGEAGSSDPRNVPIPLESLDLRAILDSAFNIAGALGTTLTSAISSVAGLVSTLLLAIFVSFLLLLDLPNNGAAVFYMFPKNYRREYALMLTHIERVWNGFFQGQVLIGIIIGLLTWLVLSLLGITNAATLAFITGVISLIPTLGGFIALVPLAIVPLLTGSTVLVDWPNFTVMLAVVVSNLIISQVIWNVVAPSILGDALDLPLVVIIVGVFIGGALGGILGAFLVAPIMGTIRVIVEYLFDKLGERDPFPDEPVPERYRAFVEAEVR